MEIPMASGPSESLVIIWKQEEMGIKSFIHYLFELSIPSIAGLAW